MTEPIIRVAGLDLSLTSTGMCFAEQGTIVELRTVKSKGRRSDTLADRRERLFAIANEVVDAVNQFQPGLVVVEAPSYGSRFGSAHDRSGLWWLIVGALLQDFPVALVSPQGRAKYGTGAGNSKKDVVEAFVREVYQDLCPRRIANDDEADALLCAAMGSRQLGVPLEAVRPSDRSLEALEGVLWPSV